MEEETGLEKKKHGLEYEIQQLKQFLQVKEAILEEKKCISPLESSLEKELEEIHKYIRQTIVEKEYLIYQVHEYQRHIIDSEIHENLSIYSPTPSPTHKNTSSLTSLPSFSASSASSPTKSRQSTMNLSPISSFLIDKSLITPTKDISINNNQKNTNKQSEKTNKSSENKSNILFSDSISHQNQDITKNISEELDNNITEKNPREMELEQLFDKLCHEKETIIKILIKLMGKTQFQTCLQEANDHSMDLLDYLQVSLPQLQQNNNNHNQI